LKWYEKALAIDEKVPGKEHPDTATTYNNIAGVYFYQGDNPRRWSGMRSHDNQGEGAGQRASRYRDNLQQYRTCVYYQGDYPMALKYMRRHWHQRESAGKEHPTTATTYDNIEVCIITKGIIPRRWEWYEKALGIREKVLGKEHPDTATTYNNIAGVYEGQRIIPSAECMRRHWQSLRRCWAKSI
jgi:tetratricopeptide (TPR) repeat protein